MAIVTVTQRIEAPAEAVWNLISWHGVGQLAGGALFKKIVFFGDSLEVGITKQLHLAEGLPVLERLESFDAADRTYRYRVIDSGSLPVTDYAGYVRVTPCGPEACHVKIECSYTGVEVSDAEWHRLWTKMELGLIDEVRSVLAGAAVRA